MVDRSKTDTSVLLGNGAEAKTRNLQTDVNADLAI